MHSTLTTEKCDLLRGMAQRDENVKSTWQHKKYHETGKLIELNPGDYYLVLNTGTVRKVGFQTRLNVRWTKLS